jgi:pyroglutamyl-peptidase
MRNGPILITSFQPWRAHQRSNSSHDLLAELYACDRLPTHSVWLPQVPVSFAMAPMYVITEIARLRPRLVICCGMAENRPGLSVERQAKKSIHPADTACVSKTSPITLQTSVKVSDLLAGTLLSDVSEDAGSYVCNHLYYNVLRFVGQVNWPTKVIFIHVPCLNLANRRLILDDFVTIVTKLSEQSG